MGGKKTFSANNSKLVEDIRLVEESYGSFLTESDASDGPPNGLGELVGVLKPNAAPTLRLVLAPTTGRRVLALLNYTSGADGLSAAYIAAGIKTLIASRLFIEKTRLTSDVEQLS